MIVHSKLNIPKAQDLGTQAIRMAGLGILVIVFIWLPASAANGSGVTDENVALKIEKAHTVEDHQALKVYFDRKVAEATKQVRLHEDMLQSYRRRPKADGFAIRLRSHCLSLIRISGDAQQNYKHLAELHSELAGELAK